MNAKGYASIPSELFYWITFLSKALPTRSIGTFIELLIGSMLTTSGFVTEAYLILDMRNHWTSYYKWLNKGKWSWLGLARQFVILALKVIGPQEVLYLVIDDTLTLRSSKKAPGSQIHHQHGNKPNLAKYVRGQCWVSLALIAWRKNGMPVALPLLSRLIPAASNTGKLIAANTLIRAVYRLFSECKKVRILVDSWYMRKILITSMLSRGFHVIGQARIDTRLYDEPPEQRKPARGRPKKYGEKLTRKRVAHLKKTEVTMVLRGKPQKLRYRTRLAKARFLEGRLVRAVWCEFQEESGNWKSTRLLISTDASMSAEEVIEAYSARWPIESMFNQLKLAWGLKEAWQQTRQTLHRWVHITNIGYALIELLGTLDSQAVNQLCMHSPWRVKNEITAGQVRKGLKNIFNHVDVRSWWCAKRNKFGPPI